MTRTIFACISSWPKIWFYFEIHVELGEGLPGSNISSVSFNARSSGRLKNRLADLFWLRFDQINSFRSVLMISGPWFMAHSLGWAIDRIDSNSEKTLSISDNRVRWLPDPFEKPRTWNLPYRTHWSVFYKNCIKSRLMRFDRICLFSQPIYNFRMS